MKRLLLTLTLLLTGICLKAQTSYIEEIKHYQKELNEEFASPEKSPLTEEDRAKFKELPFFPINEAYKVEAKFIRTHNSVPFEMPTTTARKPVYEKYGEAHFKLNGKDLVLSIYQSHSLREKAEYKDHLFLPFMDLTNGKESYGGGRFLDLTIPEGDTIVIDFNKAYNPYCAYNHKYSCPIPPKENDMNTEIKAGVKK
ncbi:hypothetical protein D3C80_696300 [compost metagenome]